MKKAIALVSLCLMAVLVLVMASAFVLLPVNIAYADDSIEVVQATVVGSLENNATAGKSLRMIYKDSTPFYIPESYFIIIESQVGPYGYNVEYCGEKLFIETGFNSEFITVGANEILSPDVRLTLANEQASLLSQKVTNMDGVDVTEYISSKTIDNDYTIKLLGYNNDGTKIFVTAVFNGEKSFGFIAIEDLEPFAVPYQQRTQILRDELIAAKNEANKPGLITPPNTSVALRIILIVGIAVPTLIIILLLFKPSKDERRYAKNSVRNSRSRDDFDYDDSRSFRNRRDYDRDYDRRYDRDYDRDYDRRRDYDRDYDDRRDYDRRDYDRDDYRR